MFEHDLGEETQRELVPIGHDNDNVVSPRSFCKLRFKLRTQIREGNILFEN